MRAYRSLIRRLLLTIVVGSAAHAVAGPGGTPIKLPGKIALQASDLVAKHPEQKAVSHIPFKVSELTALVPAAHISIIGGAPHVQLKGKMVSLATYVAELNSWEHFLNKLGYSLRDGPLARARRPHDVAITRADMRHREQLGVILQLRPKKEKPSHHVDINKPTKRPFIEPVEDPLHRLGNPPRAGRVFTPDQLLLRSNGPLAGGRLNRAALRLPDSVATDLARLMSPQPGPPCTPFPGTGTGLNPCCEHDDENNKPPGSESSTSAGQTCGTKSEGDPACLFHPQGVMDAKWDAIASCEKANSGKSGWFNASICMEMGFVGKQKNAAMLLRNAGTSHFDIRLFGVGFSLLEASAFSQYDGEHTSDVKVRVPLTGETLGSEGFLATYDSPPITIPVGPVSIVITGGGKAQLGFDQLDTPFTAPPTNCSAGTGVLGLGLTQRAYADLHLTAALDAWVAQAGIKGVLTIADDTYTLRMTDTIDPGNNSVTVQPEFTYDIRHLAGNIYLFVTINTLVYSKTFEVEIFDFKGIDPPPKNIPVPAAVYSSKLAP